MFKFDDTTLYGKDAMDSLLKSYSTAAKGFQAIAAESADYSKRCRISLPVAAPSPAATMSMGRSPQYVASSHIS